VADRDVLLTIPRVGRWGDCFAFGLAGPPMVGWSVDLRRDLIRDGVGGSALAGGRDAARWYVAHRGLVDVGVDGPDALSVGSESLTSRHGCLGMAHGSVPRLSRP